ncbi:FACT complex subunit Ssrp1 [Diorhabda carinulata]|uniref:FACT complex subunit Ssrp1 n=1 Tax=Diorhabda carinulata TaxID=1163345 RepID=UPI0025A12E6D|nr:FACT complex subunit Ssrp1 [Diorhabda carinulata]
MELEFSDISAEIKGCMTAGKLKLTEQNLIFKNSKSGKVQQIPATDFDVVNFQNFAGTWGIRLFLKNGTLHRFVGFKDSDKDKIAKFFSKSYKIEMLEKELSTKGWNWGTAKFNGSVLSFDVGSNSSFEIPLNHVSQCTGGKNEITMEFHQNDDAPVSLMEMRFFIPATEMAGDVDPVEAFQQQVMNKASVINISGDAIAIFREIHCLTPRGRYDIKIFQTFFQLHGKTFDYKIPMTTVLRLFLLPHKDSRQMFFVVSLDPPIKQGQTRYHFLVFLFNQDETSVELPFTDEELKEKFDGKLKKELSGPTFEVMSNIMKHIINTKLTGPGAFIGHSGTPAISCSYKAAAGLLYPLERGFIYVHKPPIHIRFEEITSVNFARGGGNTRTFDFEIELKSGTVHTFSSIEKGEYGKLFDFITKKKLNIKNRGKTDKTSYKDDFGDSDEEAAPDAYLARVKAEGQEREDDDDDEEDESTDEDFNPNQVESDVAEEYDSNHSSSSEDDDEEGGGDGDKKEKKKEKKKTKTVSEAPRKKREKKEKGDNKPKRAITAFMLWLNANRDKIKEENKGISFTDIAKKGGELWRELKDKSEWEEKAKKDKERYEAEMKEFKASGGATSGESKKSSGKKDKKPSVKRSASPKLAEGKIKSKEYIDDSDTSDDNDDKPAKKKEAGKSKKDDAQKSKKKDESSDEDKDDDDDDEEEEEKMDDSSEDEKDKESESEEERGKKRKKESDDDTD